MFSSFSAALSALSAHATAVEVVGNNLANLNTPGYKTSDVVFSDLMARSLGTGGGMTQVGSGVGRPLTIRNFSQGAIQSTSGDLDAAIQGSGFFVVRNSEGAAVYTRVGRFQVDMNGQLVTATGEQVLGWNQLGGTVNTNGPVTPINFPLGTLKASKATTEFSLDANLDASSAAGTQFTSFVDVIDSQGVSHTITLTFTKSATNGQWGVTATIPGAEVTGGTVGTPSPITLTPATLTFDANGTLPAYTAPGQVTLSAINLNNGASPLNLKWNLYTEGGQPRITQIARESAISANQQNGSAAAMLVRVNIGNGAQVVANYSDGEQVVVAQLAMAMIQNPDSLLSIGNNSFKLSAKSATPAIGLPSTGGRGDVLSGAIEFSTTDIAREFTNLILYQRGYQANSKVVTTVDEMSQETMNLKR